MKTTKPKTENQAYLRNIKIVWELKEEAYQQTKDLNFTDYVHFIQKDIKSIKEKLKDQIVRF